MALKIRLQRHGASHRPFYRMVVTEALARRDGRFVEVLGTYEPQAKRAGDELRSQARPRRLLEVCGCEAYRHSC